jgi:two-component system sensor histidine kinase HydH
MNAAATFSGRKFNSGEGDSAMMGLDVKRESFNLTRWFGAASFLAIASISAVLGVVVSHFLTREIMDRDAILTAQFIQSVAETEGMQYGLGDKATVGEILQESFKGDVPDETRTRVRSDFLLHFYTLPDVLHANIFGPDRHIIWSTNSALVGRMPDDNDELDEAIATKKPVATGHTNTVHSRVEQAFLTEPEEMYIENYIPLFDTKGAVTAVVEVYKEPKSLTTSIRAGHRLVWGCTVAGGLLSYLALFWIVRRAAKFMEYQQGRLVASETMAVIGEMSAAVAHSIRSPLASIRSSAELGLQADDGLVGKNLQDIITQVDRVGRWVRDLLVFSRPIPDAQEPVRLDRLVQDSLDAYQVQLEKAGVRVDISGVAMDAPLLQGNRALFVQAFNSVISNAIEAMPNGGMLRIASTDARRPGMLEILVSDTGTGMSRKQLDQVFKPFFTTKRNGLGLGLALAKRIMERSGGLISVASEEGKGAEVRLQFRVSA